MNKVLLIGRLGRDPEVRTTANGNFTTFSLATDESYVDRAGQRQTRTEWHRIVAFGRQGELCAQFLRKGAMCAVEGTIQYRSYQNQQGATQNVTDIRAIRVEFLTRANQQGQPQDGPGQYQQGGYGQGYGAPQGGYGAPQGGYPAPQPGYDPAWEQGGYGQPAAPAAPAQPAPAPAGQPQKPAPAAQAAPAPQPAAAQAPAQQPAPQSDGQNPVSGPMPMMDDVPPVMDEVPF